MNFPMNVLGFLFRQPTEQESTKAQDDSLLSSQKPLLPLNHSGQQLHSRNLSEMRISSLDSKEISTYLSSRTTLKDVHSRKTSGHVRYLNSITSFTVFKIAQFPNLIFKLPSCETSLQNRYQNHCYVAQTARDCGFDRLIIPEVVVSTLSDKRGQQSVIVENALPILNGNRVELLQHYANHDKALESAVEQMARLICITQLTDIKPQNLPLMVNPDTGEICFALVDLDNLPDRPFAEGIFGANDGAEPAYGLLNYFPRHAKKIAEAVRSTLPEDKFEQIEKRLQKHLATAHMIMTREQDIGAFHARNETVLGDPVIPESMIEDILVKNAELRKSDDSMINTIIPSDEDTKKIVSMINNEASIQNKGWDSLVYSREWKLTLSRSLGLIYFKYHYINECLIPFLKEKGYVHSVLNEEQSLEHNVHIRRGENIGTFEIIVQF